MAINPIQNPLGPVQMPGGAGGATGAAKSKPADSFQDMLKSQVDRFDADQQASAAAIKDYLAGRTQDIVPVVSAVAKADMSFKLLIGVRNKVIEAYKQTLNMNV